MSLEACPVCGYALSTETSRCRHCPPGAQFKGVNGAWLNALGYAVALGCVVYLIFFR